jgi:hypothetical protein
VTAPAATKVSAPQALSVKLRCYGISEGRQPIVDPEGQDTGRTEVKTLTVSLWDHTIARNVHTDRVHTVTFTSADPSEFERFRVGGLYTMRLALESDP